MVSVQISASRVASSIRPGWGARSRALSGRNVLADTTNKNPHEITVMLMTRHVYATTTTDTI
jgi:hypothetical protein